VRNLRTQRAQSGLDVENRVILLAKRDDLTPQFIAILFGLSPNSWAKKKLRLFSASYGLSKVSLHGIDRKDRVAKALSDLFGWQSFDTKSSQNLIVFVEALLWLEEEAAKLIHTL
jgi:hypothetical protein